MLSFTQPSRLFLLSLATVGSLFFGSCKSDDPIVATPNTVTDYVTKDTRFTYLRAAVVRAGLAETLRGGTLTVFAPTNDAFIASGYPTIASIEAVPVSELTTLLQYHVLNSRVTSSDIPTAANTPVQSLLTNRGTLFVTKAGTSVSVNGSTVTQADQSVDNGVVHVINGVLRPPTGSVVDLVTTPANAASFSILTAAVIKAGLATDLASTTGVTIFAPTDAAFAQESITLAMINSMTPAQVTRVLQYHIVPARAFSTNLTDGASLPTLLTGATLRANVSGTGVTVTGTGNGTRSSRVVTPNILTTTGVVHVIDRLLLPPP